ncbi:thiol reductant ABC exporter subunit CydD [Phycicoccus sp. 3266]|uniref:thiol reductant ABC exporter subunit CydD n=1 Tax=Phycicoccus sp. 3266 TaxID=2817751 RepID=UPI0028634555|nr:thiol reductant ABC exporter subunit CydD [Phycicoccus sp. 3266]MDR6863346.1 ATP-binding cassette subfamily C protein CydD/ATP-binding cassette subfamily C protein CydCD [Phycicoccus sp. 3266]
MRPFDPQLLRTVPEARRPLAVLAAVGIASGVATVATAFALTAVVVAVVRGTSLAEPAAYLVALFVVRGLLAHTGERVAARAGTTVSSALRHRLVARWLGAPVETRPDPATAVTLATSGSASVEPYVARFLPALVTAAVVPALAVVVMVVVDPLSALVVVLTLPLLPVFAALIGATTQDATQRRWQALAGLSGHFLDVVRGLPTLVSYGRGERQVEVVGAVSQRHRVATMATLRLAFLSSAALELLASICVAIVAVFVGIRLTHGTVDLSTGLLAILLAPEAYWPVRRVGAEFHNAADGAQALADATRELAGDDPQAGPAEPPVPTVPGISVRGLAYTHPGADRPTLTGLDLDAGPGLTAVTGPSGIGKTTLLELLAGLRTPDAGVVRAPATHLVTQRPFLTAGTVRENLTLGTGPDTPADAVWSALRAVGLDGVVAALPQGLDTRLGDDGRGLSAGQRARLVLARAALGDAPVVLLDEPTAHLDDDSMAMAHKAIRALADSRCVVAVTHRPELVALADSHVHLGAEHPQARAVLVR